MSPLLMVYFWVATPVVGFGLVKLQARLERLIEQGVLERSRYQERPPRYEYRLTEKGLDLWPVVVSLMQWGDRYTPPAGGPRHPSGP